MSQQAGTTRNTNFFFLCWVIIFMSEWTGYASSLKAQAGVQWLATPLSQPDPLWLASWGWPSPTILPPQGLNQQSHDYQPNASTTKPCGWWNFMSKCVYICSDILNYQGNSKIQKFKNLHRSGIEPMTSSFSVSPVIFNH